MNPDSVVEKLGKAGIILSRQTLWRYEKQGLISPGKRGSGGRGVGRWTEYGENVLVEAWAAWLLLNGKWVEHLRNKVFNTPACISPQTIKWMRESYPKERSMVAGIDTLIQHKKDEIGYLSRAEWYETMTDILMGLSLIALYGALIEKGKPKFLE